METTIDYLLCLHAEFEAYENQEEIDRVEQYEREQMEKQRTGKFILLK